MPDPADRPRERLSAQGAEALSDAELLGLVLRTGVRGAPASRVAHGLLERFGGLRALAGAALAELGAASGMGPSKSASVVAAFELGRRLAARRVRPGQAVLSPRDVHLHFHPRLRDAPHERFLVVLLDGRHRFLREVMVSQGTLTASLVHPREVFRAALREAAAAVLLVHNHPSGDPSPSREDVEITERLVRAGRILGVDVLDHVIVAEQGYVSLRETGRFPDAAHAQAGSGRWEQRGG